MNSAARLAVTLLVTARLFGQTNCDIATATPWIQKWFDAWELSAKDILRIGKASAPGLRLLR